jgi:hypothetical protein
MSADAVVYALLSGATPVTALVGTKIYPTVAPEATLAPFISFQLISNVRNGAIDAQATRHVAVSRIQVNLVAVAYATLKAMRATVIAACQFQRGTIAGISVISVLPAGDSPISFDGELGLFHQAVDLAVTLYE